MATMTVTSQSTNTTAYGSRLATLEVVGIFSRSGHQTITVPLDRLSQKMQQVHRQGGKIISVHTDLATRVVPSPIESVEAVATTPTPDISEAETELAMEVPTPAVSPKQNNHSSKKKRR
jgi:hypothetical protein